MNLQSHIEQVVQALKERASCSAPGCPGRKLWARTAETGGSILMHERRFCFPVCFDEQLRTRLADLRITAGMKVRPPHRVPLGLLMLSRGQLTREQLRNVLQSQKRNGSLRIGEWMQRLGYAEEPQVTAALGKQWSCPVLRELPAPVSTHAIPFVLLQLVRMAPVAYNRATRALHLAFAGNVDYRALLAIETMLDCKAEACIADGSAVQAWLESYKDQRRGADQTFENIRAAEEIIRITSSYATQFCADEARLADCGGYIWIRVCGGKHSANLLFRQPSAS